MGTFWTTVSPHNAFSAPLVGNGRTTSRVLLCLERELTEFCGKLGEFCEKLGAFAFARKKKAERNSLSSLPGARRGPKNSLSSVFESLPSETVFGPSPLLW